MPATTSSREKTRLRPPPLRTTSLDHLPRESAPHPPRLLTPQLDRHSEAVDAGRFAAKPGHQRFVLTDPIAFRYLQDDPSTTVLERRTDLSGYECYLVEQWTTSRMHPTFVITTYTGDPSHTIKVGVLSLPIDESTWPPRLRVYFKALNQYHATRRETPLGILMVTNLSGFPSSLAVIRVPGGNVSKYRFDFYVNQDLKRLGCSGRIGLSLAQPAASTVAKFHQLYRTSEKNDIYISVIELIKLCQSALTLFDKLEVDYADGLLCDVTERAVSDWWVEIGNDHYNTEPHDGILGPTTVAGLLGMLLGARNRLHAVGAPVSKDPFDVDVMKRAISAFQKQQHMPRTRRLDRRTLARLHKATQKAAEKERWAVPRAVKSTVAELSGKGGDMADGFGRRDRAGIAEIETVDLDHFVQLVYGDRCKWLWFGKTLKKSKVHDGAEFAGEVRDTSQASKDLVFKPDDHGGFTWAACRKSTVDGVPPGKREQAQQHDDVVTPTPGEEGGDTSGEDIMPSVFKRAATIKNDAKSGLGKVKGVVGFRGHKPKPSVDEPVPSSPVEQKFSKRPLLRRSHTSPLSSPNSPDVSIKDQQRETNAAAEQTSRLRAVLGSRSRSGTDPRPGQEISNVLHATTQVASKESLQHSALTSLKQNASEASSEHQNRRDDSAATADASASGSAFNGDDLKDISTEPETEGDVANLLRRTVSYSQYIASELQPHSDDAYPRHLSFSLAEESVLTWEPIAQESTGGAFGSLTAQLAEQRHVANKAKLLQSQITLLHFQTGSWTSTQLQKLQTVLDRTERNVQTLDALHLPHARTVTELQAHALGVLQDERQRFEGGSKEIESLAAKLEYEMDALKGKVEDVHAAVGDYEKGVVRVEERVMDLEREGEKGNGWVCAIQ